MWDVVVDSILDTLKLLPLLFLVYLLIEWIERKTAGGWRGNRLLRGRWAPLIGSTVGLLPQCGFSVIVTNLYAGGLVGLGALISVYLATSDEAIPILLSQPEQIGKILPLLRRNRLVGQKRQHLLLGEIRHKQIRSDAVFDI